MLESFTKNNQLVQRPVIYYCMLSLPQRRALLLPRPRRVLCAKLHVIAALTIVLCAIGASSAVQAGDEVAAAERPSLDLGKALAEKHCSICHAVGPQDVSPTDVNKNTAFRLLYQRFPIEMLVDAQKTGRISGHDEMPGFDFTMAEIRALLSYVDSLSPEYARYIRPAGD